MKPNILFVSTPKSWRGGEFQIFELIKALRENANVFVFCPAISELHHRCKENGITVIGYKKTFPTPLFVSRQLKKNCKKHAIDLIHNNDSGAQTISYIASLLFGFKTISVLSKRTIFPFSKGKLSTAKYTHTNLKKIICVSKAAEKVVLKNYNYPEKVVVINDGIDLKAYSAEKKNILRKEFNLSQNDRLIGFVGSLSEEKGISYLIDAFSTIKKQMGDSKLILIGDGPLKETLIQQVKDSDLENHVIFAGFRNDVAQIFKELDVFVLPSLAEGYPNVILEAFISKVPVIATNVGGIPEIIEHRKNGLIVPAKNKLELAKNIAEILKEGQMADRLVKNAFGDITNKHTIEITANKMLSTYMDVLEVNREMHQ